MSSLFIFWSSLYVACCAFSSSQGGVSGEAISIFADVFTINKSYQDTFPIENHTTFIQRRSIGMFVPGKFV